MVRRPGISKLRFCREASVFLCVAVALLCVRQEAQGQVPEYELKAAFLFNFGSFVEWPEDPRAVLSEDFVIGVLGRDPFGDLLDAVEGRLVRGRTVRIRRFRRIEDLNGVQVLFVGLSDAEQLAGALEALGDRPVLTVGDAPDFALRGGVVGMVLDDQRVRLEVNRCAAERAGLRISSRLLNLADLTPDSCRVDENR